MLWIFGSDHLLSLMTTELDTAVAIGKFKGAFFVMMTSAGLYFLVRSSFTALERARSVAWEQKKLFELMATNHDLGFILDSVIKLIESEAPGIRCSVLRIEEGKLRHAAAPSLPEDYQRAVDGLPIGPEVGSCGAAAYHKRRFYSNDIANDPNWEPVKELALSLDLRACWSTPIPATDGDDILGTFAIYNSVSGPPTSRQERLFALATHLATIAFEQDRARATLIDANRKLETQVSLRTAELREALERAREADKVKSAFLAAMSHELRTPLNSIIGFTGLLHQELPGPLNEEQKKQLGMIRKSSRHLLDLINDVLDISKIEAGQLKTSKERFSPKEVVQSVYDLLQPQAKKKGLAFDCSLSAEVDEVVTDQRRFRQILINLVVNAIKFTESGSVSLNTEMIEHDGQRALKVSVRDTGVGIGEKDRERVFKDFSQLDSGITRAHEGTGLGLAICKRLSKLLGGTLEFESTIGTGSTFTLTLPLAEEEKQMGDAA